jgi:hypothetical protein
LAAIDIIIEDRLLIVSVTGKLSADEVIAVVREYFSNGIVKDVIWDLTNGSLQSISRVGFEAIARAAKDALKSGSRQSGKTVFVGYATVAYDLMRMSPVVTDITDMYVEYNICETLEEARNWLVREA